MKKNFVFLLAGIISLTAGMMVSCGSNDNDDNNEGTVGELPYAMQAAKYNISSSSSEWKSIELTEGGRFIAIKKGYTSGAKAATRANNSDNGIVFGTFTFDGTTYIGVPLFLHSYLSQKRQRSHILAHLLLISEPKDE